MDIGTRIKERRKSLGLSAERVAEILGVSPATIYRYESSEIMNMRTDKLEPIAQALHTTPAYLMGWDVEEPVPTHEVELSTEELDIIKKYRVASNEIKGAVKRIVES